MKTLLIFLILLTSNVYAKSGAISKISAKGYAYGDISDSQVADILTGQPGWGESAGPETEFELDLTNTNRINLKVSGAHKIESQCNIIEYTEGVQTSLFSEAVRSDDTKAVSEQKVLALTAFCFNNAKNEGNQKWVGISLKYNMTDDFFYIIFRDADQSNKNILFIGKPKIKR